MKSVDWARILTRFVSGVPQKHVLPFLVTFDLDFDVIGILICPTHIEHDPEPQLLGLVEPCIQFVQVIANASCAGNDVQDVVTQLLKLLQIVRTGA